MEPIWQLADDLGVRVITEPSWHYSFGASYAEVRWQGIIVMPAIIPIKIERWLIAHELGHHINCAYRDPVWLAEAKADRWAVKKLWELYHPDDGEWPERPAVQNCLAEMQRLEYYRDGSSVVREAAAS